MDSSQINQIKETDNEFGNSVLDTTSQSDPNRVYAPRKIGRRELIGYEQGIRRHENNIAVHEEHTMELLLLNVRSSGLLRMGHYKDK